MASISQRLTGNPVAQAELNHQRRAISGRRWRRFPLFFGLALIVAAFSQLLLLIEPQLALALRVSPLMLEETLRSWLGTLTVLMGALIMIHHLSFAIGALQLASSAIAREKQGRTWESLLLTGVDARRIVVGKWWATMHAAWHDYRLVLLARLVMVVWVGLTESIGRLIPFESLTLPSVILLALLVAVFPLFYASFTAALGLLASLLVNREATAYRVASLLHFALLVFSLCLGALALVLPLTSVDFGATMLIPALFVTPLDGGMLAVLGIASTSTVSGMYYTIGLFVSMVLYAALALGTLRAAQTLAVRQRALPPAR